MARRTVGLSEAKPNNGRQDDKAGSSTAECTDARMVLGFVATLLNPTYVLRWPGP